MEVVAMLIMCVVVSALLALHHYRSAFKSTLRQTKKREGEEKDCISNSSSKQEALENCIYVGTVLHSRHNPLPHSFLYSVYYMYTELGVEQESAFDQYWCWTSRPGQTALASLDLRNYLSVGEVQQLVREELGLEKEICRVFLLTNWKYFGIHFNPVSYYYCYCKLGNLVALISEVHNTPWSEKCRYVHPCCYSTPTTPSSSTSTSPVHSDQQPVLFRDEKDKKLHVSPFFGMEYKYCVQFNRPARMLSVRWYMHNNNTHCNDFTAYLALRRVPLSQTNLLCVLLFYPFMTLKVLAMIYWQAAKLYWKVPFYSHPKYSTPPSTIPNEEKS